MAPNAYAPRPDRSAASLRTLDPDFPAVVTRQQMAMNDWRPHRRSVARILKKRLVLGIAAMALFGLAVWLFPDEPPGATSLPPVVQRIEKSQDRVAAAAPAIRSTAQMPSWLVGVLDAPPVAVPALRPRPGRQ